VNGVVNEGVTTGVTDVLNGATTGGPKPVNPFAQFFTWLSDLLRWAIEFLANLIHQLVEIVVGQPPTSVHHNRGGWWDLVV
jgi:hypothetical protein